MDKVVGCLLATIFISLNIKLVCGTNRYYGTYTVFGSGDTIIQNFHAHLGPNQATRKWNVECMDGEAMVGIQDWTDDFGRLQQVWCKFMFPLKPPTNGLYPYYPGCHVRNYTTDFFCYDPLRTNITAHTFITDFVQMYATDDLAGLWQLNLNWWVLRIPADNPSLMKCCKTPLGYYIDYLSCYWQPTHDMYFEYYNSANHFIVQCATSFVMTGISKKVNPWKKDNIIDWIQCCRIGYGRREYRQPPIIHTRSGSQVYYDNYASHNSYGSVPSGYQDQYRSAAKMDNSIAPEYRSLNGTIDRSSRDENLMFGRTNNRRKSEMLGFVNAQNKW